MSNVKLIILFLVVGILGSLVGPTEVEGAIQFCSDYGFDCGSRMPDCWFEYCSSSCSDGCTYRSCGGGVCAPAQVCTPNSFKCESDARSQCSSDGTYWDWVGDCEWGCGTSTSCANTPPCTPYCSSSCSLGCSQDSCVGGTCIQICDPYSYSCVNERQYRCNSTGTELTYELFCDLGCAGDVCSIACLSYCDSDCEFGCITNSCNGGFCSPVPTPTLTPIPTPTPIEEDIPILCDANLFSCIDGDDYGYEYRCNSNGTILNFVRTCAYGCSSTDPVCAVSSYCEDVGCDCDAPGGVLPDGTPDTEDGYQVECYEDELKGYLYPQYIPPQCLPYDLWTPREWCEEKIISDDLCHPVDSTCGGWLNCAAPLVSRIDSCGGQDCGEPCVEPPPEGDGSPGCSAGYPMKPELSLPVDGALGDSLSIELSWATSPDYGTGCPQSNSQNVYLEAGDSSPGVLVASLGSGTTTYTASGLEGSTEYYWRVRADNGSLTMYSNIYSFTTPAIVTGTLFDASDIDNCSLMASAPKISGTIVSIVGGASYTPMTDVFGVYSQVVGVPGSYVVTPAVSDPPYTLTPKLTCQGASADFVLGGPGTVTLDFGFWREYGGWWQVIGGDVYGGGGVESVIPMEVPVDERYLIKNDADGNGGVVQYGTGGVELGGGDEVYVSETGWEAESSYGGQDVNYEYYSAKMKALEKTEWAGVGKPSYSPSIDGYEIYEYTGDATINFSVDSGDKMVFMVDGNVTVSSDVTVALGSHLTVISSGVITFNDDVGEAHGWWVADRIVIESTGDIASEIQFRGEGSFVGWDVINFNRDRGVSNNTEPAEEFTYRSDLMINAPRALKFSKYKWLEQAP